MNPALVTLHGNVSRDPQRRELPNGTSIAEFGVACTRKWKVYKANGVEDWAEEVSFFDVQCFGHLADHVLESVTKGTAVLIWGRLKQRVWEIEDGKKKSKVEVIAEEIGMSLRYSTVVVDRPRQAVGGGAAERPRSSSRQPSGADFEPDEEPF